MNKPFKFVPRENDLSKHRRWLEHFDARHSKAWERLLASDAEAAMCEANVRRLLSRKGCGVEPNTDKNPSGKSPDFKCRRDGNVFYVEATCLTISAATRATNLDHLPETGGAQNYSLPTQALWNDCRNKAPQCADLPHPTLVAIGTFHSQVTRICTLDHVVEDLVLGERLIAFDIDTTKGRAVGPSYGITKLKGSTVLKPGLGHPVDARRSVSGMLVVGFGLIPWHIKGTLHHDAVRPFDRNLLPTIRFCRLARKCAPNTLRVEWV